MLESELEEPRPGGRATQIPALRSSGNSVLCGDPEEKQIQKKREYIYMYLRFTLLCSRN